MHLAFGFRIAPSRPLIEKTTMTSYLPTWHLQKIFDVVVFLLSRLVNGRSFKFHVNIIIGSGVTKIFVLKGFDQKFGNSKYPVWVLSNIWRLQRVRDTKYTIYQMCQRRIYNSELSMMDIFCKSSIAVVCSCKKLHHRCFAGF